MHRGGKKKTKNLFEEEIAQSIFKYNLKWIDTYTKPNLTRKFVSRSYVDGAIYQKHLKLNVNYNKVIMLMILL
jgi:hypothetical protein